MVENEALSDAASGGEVSELATPPVKEPEDEPLEVESATATSEEQEAGACAARLVLVRSGAETEQVFEFTAPAVIGRFDPAVGPVDVDLGVIDEGRYVSRKHARIACENGVWTVADLGSSNGTYVLRGDFERVEEAELVNGEQIAFGNARFIFRIP